MKSIATNAYPYWAGGRFLSLFVALLVLGGCASAPSLEPVTSGPPDTIRQARSQWVAVSWSELPGLEEDNLFDAWSAWVAGCERAVVPWTALCGEVRSLSIASGDEQRQWMRKRLQPYRVQSLQGETVGQLTGYYEPVLEASRVPTDVFSVPLYRPPSDLAQRKPWFSRREMDTLPAAQAALQGKAIAYVANPVDAMVLQVQGSARLQLRGADGMVRSTRIAYAGSNDQPFRSPGRWLLEQGLVRDASWAGIKVWMSQNPGRAQELIWSNPRVVFFREDPVPVADTAPGPRGAQGVRLTPGRSIAVDPLSIPLGTPLWLASGSGPSALRKLVIAQDGGSAISGAVRADYFVGSGLDAGEQAGRIRQNLQLWALWPKPPGSR